MTDLHELFQQRLFNAVRDTLETMAFAEVVSCSVYAESSALPSDGGLPPTAGTGAWGTPSTTTTETNAWGQPAETPPENAWGTPAEQADSRGAAPTPDEAWGETAHDASAFGGPPPADANAYFDELLKTQKEFIWARIDVHSEAIASIYLIVSKSLAKSLMDTMYAGDTCETDVPMLRDTVAELANTLCGRLMLGLEDRLGKFRLDIPATGEGMPELPEGCPKCKMLVDGAHAVLGAIITR